MPSFLLFICILILFSLLPFHASSSPLPNSTILLPDPNAVVRHLQRRLDLALRSKDSQPSSSCLTGNPIDDCWLCSGSDWRSDRQRLADCGIGFGRNALGGKGGPMYIVSDSSDLDPVNPKPGTLRHAAIQEGPLDGEEEGEEEGEWCKFKTG